MWDHWQGKIYKRIPRCQTRMSTIRRIWTEKLRASLTIRILMTPNISSKTRNNLTILIKVSQMPMLTLLNTNTRKVGQMTLVQTLKRRNHLPIWIWVSQLVMSTLANTRPRKVGRMNLVQTIKRRNHIKQTSAPKNQEVRRIQKKINTMLIHKKVPILPV